MGLLNSLIAFMFIIWVLGLSFRFGGGMIHFFLVLAIFIFLVKRAGFRV